ncbi:hypothetical protein HN446_02415 [bacterium]|jgi:hypothetical protein|nr:hypothetical protein [bacterium]
MKKIQKLVVYMSLIATLAGTNFLHAKQIDVRNFDLSDLDYGVEEKQDLHTPSIRYDSLDDELMDFNFENQKKESPKQQTTKTRKKKNREKRIDLSRFDLGDLEPQKKLKPKNIDEKINRLEDNFKYSVAALAIAHAKMKNDIEKKNITEDKKEHNLFCTFRNEILGGTSLELFNSANINDGYLFGQSQVDLGFNLFKNKKQTNNKKFDIGLEARFKAPWGKPGAFTKISDENIKVGYSAITTSPHTHSIDRQMLWLRKSWLDFKIDFDSPNQSKKQGYIKAGLFPYSIGSGISLGDAHIVGQEIPGLYSENFVDQFRPGITAGINFSDKLLLEAYLGIIETENNNFIACAEFTQTQNGPDSSSTGSFNNNFVTSGAITWSPYQKREFSLNIKPYMVFHHNNIQTVEFPNDSNMQMGILGLELNYKKNRLEFDIEAATNIGRQTVKEWDRNIIEAGSIPRNTHLFMVSEHGSTSREKAAMITYINDGNLSSGSWSEIYLTGSDGKQKYVATYKPPYTTTAAMTTQLSDYPGTGAYWIYTYKGSASSPEQAQNYANGAIFTSGVDGGTTRKYKNSYTRFRKKYINTLHGCMFHMGASYTLGNETTTKIGGAVGIISGDKDPNNTQESILVNRSIYEHPTLKDYDKTYSGFVGTEQLYNNKHLLSLFVMDARKFNKPLSISPRMTPTNLTNTIFIGAGTNTLFSFEKSDLRLRQNIVAMFEASKTKYGYDPTIIDINYVNEFHPGVFTNPDLYEPNEGKFANYNKYVSKFLGLEYNISLDYSFKKDFNFFLISGMFIPGSHYTERKGTHIPLREQVKLASIDYSRYTRQYQAEHENFEKFNITLGDNVALYFNCGLQYKFDSLFKTKNKNIKNKFKTKDSKF